MHDKPPLVPPPAPAGLVSYPNAGKDVFNELMYARKFLKKSGEMVTSGTELYVYQDGVFRPADVEKYHALALGILPESLRTHKNAEAVLKHAVMQTQMQLDEQMHGAYKFTGPDEQTMLLNVANGILRVTGDAVKLLPHSAT